MKKYVVLTFVTFIISSLASECDGIEEFSKIEFCKANTGNNVALRRCLDLAKSVTLSQLMLPFSFKGNDKTRLDMVEKMGQGSSAPLVSACTISSGNAVTTKRCVEQGTKLKTTVRIVQICDLLFEGFLDDRAELKCMEELSYLGTADEGLEKCKKPGLSFQERIDCAKDLEL
ncbi:MAG: hypothetical protein R2827_14495 [Bdellovibrionales bacterium]